MSIADKALANYFLPYQVDWILDPAKAMIWPKSRRIGATYCDSYKSVRERTITDQKRDLWFSSADESAAYEYALYCKQWCEILDAAFKEDMQVLEDEKGFKYSNYIIEFPWGSRINCMTSNPRRFRSKGGDIVLDEFAWHEEARAMRDAAQPCLVWGYNMRILSSHNGEDSEFNNIIRQVEKVLRGDATFKELHMLEWSMHKITIVDAIEQGLAEKVYKLKTVDPAAREKFLAECRALARNEDAWNQEFMCVPSVAASCLIPYDLYQSCEDSECLKTMGTGPKYLGIDIGRINDPTVMWLDEHVADLSIARKVLRLVGVPYSQQLQHARELLKDRSVVRACVDATGQGDMFAESLQEEFGAYRVEKVKFSQPVKEAMAARVLSRFVDRRTRVPADRQIRDSFHAIRKTTTAAGNVRYDAARTQEGHADEFWGKCLAEEAAAEGTVKPEIIWL